MVSEPKSLFKSVLNMAGDREIILFLFFLDSHFLRQETVVEQLLYESMIYSIKMRWYSERVELSFYGGVVIESNNAYQIAARWTFMMCTII